MAPIWMPILLAVLATVNGQACTEGSTRVQYSQYYVCRNGNLVPVACAYGANRIEPFQTTRLVDPNFVHRCQQTGQSYALVPIACLKDGQQINIGSTYNDENFYFTCSQEGSQVSMRATGCKSDHGQVGPNGIAVKDRFLFRCTMSGGRIGMEPYGCIVQGSHHPAGQIITTDFWYDCRIIPGGLQMTVGGCMNHGQKMYPGNTVTRENFVFRCEVGEGRAGLVVVGCLDDRGGQRMIGERWHDGPGPLLTVWECKREGDRISKKAAPQCYYQGADGSGPLEPNCVRRFGTTLIKCINRGGDRVSAEMYSNASDQTFRDAINAGFRQC